MDVLIHEYALSCANGGSAGVDGETFRNIEDQGGVPPIVRFRLRFLV